MEKRLWNWHYFGGNLVWWYSFLLFFWCVILHCGLVCRVNFLLNSFTHWTRTNHSVSLFRQLGASPVVCRLTCGCWIADRPFRRWQFIMLWFKLQSTTSICYPLCICILELMIISCNSKSFELKELRLNEVIMVWICKVKKRNFE